MIRIGNLLITGAVTRERFSCDLDKCHGACCVVGDYGAPVTVAEAGTIREHLDVLTEITGRPYDPDRISTHTVEGLTLETRLKDGGCIFLVEKGKVHLCGIQMAYDAGRFPFPKPLSCHLFPLVETRTGGGGRLVIFERRDTCEACIGEGPILAEYLQEPLKRAYGEEVAKEVRGRSLNKSNSF